MRRQDPFLRSGGQWGLCQHPALPGTRQPKHPRLDSRIYCIARRTGLYSFRSLNDGMNVKNMRQKAMGSRVAINDGLRALEEEPQQNPFKTHHARAELRRGLLVVDNLLRNLEGMR